MAAGARYVEGRTSIDECGAAARHGARSPSGTASGEGEIGSSADRAAAQANTIDGNVAIDRGISTDYRHSFIRCWKCFQCPVADSIPRSGRAPP